MENLSIAGMLIPAITIALTALMLLIALAQRNKKLFSAALFLNYRRMELAWVLMFLATLVFMVYFAVDPFFPMASLHDFAFVTGLCFAFAACLIMYQSLSKYGKRHFS